MKKFLKFVGATGLVVAAGAAVKVFCDLGGVSAAARRMGLDRDCFHDYSGHVNEPTAGHQFNVDNETEDVKPTEAVAADAPVASAEGGPADSADAAAK